MFLMRHTEKLIDPVKLLEEYVLISSGIHFHPTLRADGSILRSISITSRPDSADRLHDGNESQFDSLTNRKIFSESEFVHFNQEFYGTIFEEIYNNLDFRPGRMRINVLPPLTVFRMHRDSAPRAHFAVRTDEHCFLSCLTGETHHVRADGRMYVFDTTQAHTAFNSGYCQRIHLTISLADQER